jgi:predicted dienelactone hydrolase
MGPFTPTIQNSTGPDNAYRLDYPKPLGDAGLKHPLVVFAAGGGFPENYDTLLRYLASHGFVVLTYAATSEDGKGLLDGVDWLIAQNAATSGMLSGKLDTAHVAASGHSFGSLAAFNAAPDARLTTTVHLQGGSLDPHDVVKKLRAPAQFICGETPTGDQDGTFTGDMANPNCAIDFAMAQTPVFYASLKGAAHIQLTESVEAADDRLRLRMLGAIGGWLRWWLAGDESQRSRYVGSDCELCKPDTGWTVMQKGL